MGKVEITKDAVLQPGDEIEMHYAIIGPAWLRAAQIAAIESKLEKEERFYMLGYRFEGPNERTLVIKIAIREPPAAEDGGEPLLATIHVTVIVTAIAAVGTSIFVWLSLKQIYKIVQTPGGAAAVGLTGAAGLVVAGLLILYFFKRSG